MGIRGGYCSFPGAIGSDTAGQATAAGAAGQAGCWAPGLLSLTAAGGVTDRRAGSARPAQANRHYGQANRDHDSGSDAPGGRNGRHCQQQGDGGGGEGGGSHGRAATSAAFQDPVSRRSGASRGRRPGLEAQPGGRVPRLAAGPGQPVQQLTSRARAGHHHHRGPRPGDPLQLLPGALGDGFPGGGVVDRFGHQGASRGTAGPGPGRQGSAAQQIRRSAAQQGPGRIPSGGPVLGVAGLLPRESAPQQPAAKAERAAAGVRGLGWGFFFPYRGFLYGRF